ncbi:MAG: phospholipid/cholesterol/gamma-HCH transport system substrate-binding protein, partial [Solirubrobacteraceae bacterium]|nr:phospholipid/cholesterol/gamma-HCH transport system substrate-binding protein [Solirubrobacteraceae bacterium]
MRSGRKAIGELFDNPILVGTVTILIVIVAVYLSYIAENGLPFVPTYNINVDVANASELVKNADVRVGGARVGQVLTITPEPATKTWPHPFARLGLALQSSLEPLPSDTRYQVRLASVLGGKYVEIIPGTPRHGGLPDGGTFTLNANPRLNHNVPFVDLDTAFATFGPKTQRGLRSTLADFGDAVAGRGTQFNDSIYSFRQLIGPLDELLRLFASPDTHVSQLISGLASTTGALAPVAPTVTALLNDAATTFGALQRSQLGQAIDQTPPTEALATTVLTNARPVLGDAATIVQALKPGAVLLPLAVQRLDAILRGATPVFKRVPQLAGALQTALAAVDALARDPASSGTFKVLGSNDLATFGSSAFVGLGAILRTVASEQFACNVTGLWVRNFASSLSEGDTTAGWLRFAPIIDLNQEFQSATPAPDLHLNYYPKENSSGCQAGNEVYRPGHVIGDPGPTSTVVDNTVPPPGV